MSLKNKHVRSPYIASSNDEVFFPNINLKHISSYFCRLYMSRSVKLLMYYTTLDQSHDIFLAIKTGNKFLFQITSA